MPALGPEALEDRKDALLEAAFRCFGRKGYRATSMRDICKEADVSIGGLYCHYASKEEIIAGVAEMFRKRRKEVVSSSTQEASVAPPSAAIASAMRETTAAVYSGDREAIRADVSLMGEAVHIPALQSLLQEADIEHFEDAERLLAGVPISDDDRRTLAQLLTATSYGLLILVAYHDDVAHDRCIDLLERLLRPTIDNSALAAEVDHAQQ